MSGAQCVGAVGNGFIRSANRVRHTECMNAFPTRGGKRFSCDEAAVRGTQCVQSVGAYRYNQAQANPSPGTRAVEDACPYGLDALHSSNQALDKTYPLTHLVGNAFMHSV